MYLLHEKTFKISILKNIHDYTRQNGIMRAEIKNTSLRILTIVIKKLKSIEKRIMDKELFILSSSLFLALLPLGLQSAFLIYFHNQRKKPKLDMDALL